MSCTLLPSDTIIQVNTKGEVRMDQEKIGSFIKNIRKEKGLTQEQLAENMQVIRLCRVGYLGVEFFLIFSLSSSVNNFDLFPIIEILSLLLPRRYNKT